MGSGLGFEPFSFTSIAILIGEVARVCGNSHLSAMAKKLSLMEFLNLMNAIV